MKNSDIIKTFWNKTIIKIGQSSYKMYSNNILNSQVSTTILNACTKKSENLLNAARVNNFFSMRELKLLVFVCLGKMTGPS